MRTIFPYLNLFSNQEAYIIGKGPTDFDYSNLSKFNGPIFFINESALLACEHRPEMKEKSFMFAHDISTKKSLIYNNDYECVIVENHSQPERKFTKSYIDINGVPVSEYAIIYSKVLENKTEFLNSIHRENALTITPSDEDRLVMRNSNWLAYKIGTIRTAICFAFYTGVSHIKLVGCDGLPKSDVISKYGRYYDRRLDHLISSTPYGNHNKHKNRAIIMMNNCRISYEFIGTPKL